jgi:hypothetical protein
MVGGTLSRATGEFVPPPPDYGVIIYFGAIAAFLIIALVAEFMATERTRRWNPWLSFLSGTTVMFRLYWCAWLFTLRPKDLKPYIDHETERMKLLTNLIFFVFTTFLIPFVLLAAGRVWQDRQKSGVVLSTFRLVPVIGLTYLFFKTLVFAVDFVARIKTSL